MSLIAEFRTQIQNLVAEFRTQTQTVLAEFTLTVPSLQAQRDFYEVVSSGSCDGGTLDFSCSENSGHIATVL